MSSRRGYRRRNYNNYVPRAIKYQFVPISINASFTNTNPVLKQVICPSSEVAGMRKVKNFNLQFVANLNQPFLWALVYVPDGASVTNINPEIINATTMPVNAGYTELFAANQWVIGCGTFIEGAINTYKTRMSRNLNSGDTVWLMMFMNGSLAEGTGPVLVNCTGNYAIRYN
uniref:Putative capsid protein n=1 Tax=Marmot associated feces virus 1 TaxID=2800896 RepID=A0A7T7DFV5_9VIRU|nr:putative capsid protein [Marmot associated feces virus 1]